MIGGILRGKEEYRAYVRKCCIGYHTTASEKQSGKGVWSMPKKKKDSFDIKDLKPEDLLKFEIAEELGLSEKVLSGGWRSLTAKESGRIGGLITKRKREMKKEALQEKTDASIINEI